MPGAGAAQAVKVPYELLIASAHFVSTAWIDGHGRSMVRSTFTKCTPESFTSTRGFQNTAQTARLVSASHGVTRASWSEPVISRSTKAPADATHNAMDSTIPKRGR